MSDTWLTRPATECDLDACAQLIASYEGGTTQEWAERFARYLANPDGHMAVAIDGNLVVGYGRVQFRDCGPRLARPDLPPGYYLSGIVVANGHRRRGIGTSLCQTRIDWVTPRGHDIWYFTNRLNTASRRLHQMMGFREVLEFTSPALNGDYGVVGHRLTDDPPTASESAVSN